MSPTDAHSKLLAAAAKTELAPLGIKQKGRSRTWLDDHGWWIGVIEFQPSSWSKGSYLNVGACWLWDEKDYLSFDYGGRVESHVKHISDVQFGPEAQRLASVAAARIDELRRTFKSPADVARLNQTDSEWGKFHAAVAYGCVADLGNARRWFAKIAQLEMTHDWQMNLQRRARQLEDILPDLQAFRSAIRESILATRRLLKLPAVEIDDLCSGM